MDRILGRRRLFRRRKPSVISLACLVDGCGPPHRRPRRVKRGTGFAAWKLSGLLQSPRHLRAVEVSGARRRSQAMETTPMNELESLAPFLRISEQLPGWIRGEEAEGLALTSLALPGSPVIVQIGTFFGSATVLLAGARRLRGTGKVHCVDPFDCSGDDFSVPHYRRLLAEAGNGPLRSHFESNIRLAGLEDWIEVHTGRAEEMIHGWTTSIDMLALGGDQSPAGARA